MLEIAVKGYSPPMMHLRTHCSDETLQKLEVLHDGSSTDFHQPNNLERSNNRIFKLHLEV